MKTTMRWWWDHADDDNKKTMRWWRWWGGGRGGRWLCCGCVKLKATRISVYCIYDKPNFSHLALLHHFCCQLCWRRSWDDDTMRPGLYLRGQWAGRQKCLLLWACAAPIFFPTTLPYILSHSPHRSNMLSIISLLCSWSRCWTGHGVAVHREVQCMQL